MSNQTIGQRGEILAASHLRKLGYHILETNRRTPYGEVDIIALEGSALCFVEVKTRSSLDFGHPFESVDERKQKHLIRAAQHYLQEAQDRDFKSLRFDVLALVGAPEGEMEYELLRGAFEA